MSLKTEGSIAEPVEWTGWERKRLDMEDVDNSNTGLCVCTLVCVHLCVYTRVCVEGVSKPTRQLTQEAVGAVFSWSSEPQVLRLRC